VKKPLSAYLPVAILVLAYGMVYAAFFFAPGLIRFDDFGYVQSVSGSISAQGLLIHDWLGPYHLPPTLLGLGLYRLTGHFLWATWGLLAVFSVLNLLLLYVWLRERLPAWSSALTALVLATFPVYAHKTSEYSGNVFALFFMLSALLAYRKAWWIPFYLLAFLGYATRQNLLALLVIPFTLILFPGSRPVNRLFHGFAGLLFALGALAIRYFSPPNFMQKHEVYQGLSPANAWPILSAFILGLWVCGLFFALGQALFIPSEVPLKARFAAIPRRPWRVLALAGSTLFLCLHPHPYVSFLTPLIGSLDRGGWLQDLFAAAMLLSVGMFRWPPRLPWEALGLVIALVGISCLRGFWYDFYFLEIAVAVLFLLLECRPSWRLSAWSKTFLLAALAGNLAWAYAYKVHCDKQRLINESYESLERQGRVQVFEMTDAPFGFLGWKLFDHFKHHDYHGRASDFQCYVQRDQVIVESEAPWRRGFKRSAPDSASVLLSGIRAIGYFPLHYRVVRLGYSNSVSLCGKKSLPLASMEYRPKPMPLNAAEWRVYLDKQASGANNSP